MKEEISAILVTADGLRHKYVAKCLSNDLNLLGVVSEAKKPFSADQSNEKGRRIIDHFNNLDEAENKYFADVSYHNLDNIEKLPIPNGEVNQDYVFDWINARNPQYLVLYGSGIVRERLLNKFDKRCINMHLGLSPYYRGSGTNLWPLVNNEPECVGVTIHLAVLDVDAGAILRQVRPRPAVKDTVHDLGCKTIKAGAENLGKTIIAYHNHDIFPVTQDLTIGKVYKRKDFNSDALVKIYENHEKGMMEDYVENMDERLKNFPIVE